MRWAEVGSARAMAQLRRRRGSSEVVTCARTLAELKRRHFHAQFLSGTQITGASGQNSGRRCSVGRDSSGQRSRTTEPRITYTPMRPPLQFVERHWPSDRVLNLPEQGCFFFSFALGRVRGLLALVDAALRPDPHAPEVGMTQVHGPRQ